MISVVEISKTLRRNWFLSFPLGLILFVISKYGLRCVDDGYYYLQIAYNVAHGKGLTFDGIHITNGFEPLWQLLLVPFHCLLTDKTAVAYAATLVEVLLFLGIGVVLSSLTSKLNLGYNAGWFACILWAFNPVIINVVSWNGMETSLLTFLIAATSYASFRYFSGEDSALLTGVLLSLCIFARLDAICFLLAFLALLLVLKKSRKDMFLILAPSLILLSSYAIVNYFIFGHIGPISGYIYTFNGIHRLRNLLLHLDLRFFEYASKNLFAIVTFNSRIPLFVGVFAFVALILSLRVLLVRLTRSAQTIVLALLGYCLLLVISYVSLYDDVGMAYTYYWSPCFILLVLFLSLIASAIKSSRVRVAYISVVLLLQFGIGSVYAADLLQMFPNQNLMKKAVRFADSNISAESRIGTWDAGYFAYFSHRIVINLDGLVNNYEFWADIEEGRLAEYVSRQRIEYIANIDYPSSRREWIERNFNFQRVYDDTLRFHRFSTRLTFRSEVIRSPQTLSGQQVFYIYRLLGQK
jgi:hypothetical protein